jgi:hypothetical protein
LRSSIIILDVLADFATIKAVSIGGMTGVAGRLVHFVIYGAQVRFIGDDFMPTYFDTNYDVTRPARFALIEGELSSPGYTGWLGTLGVSLFSDLFVLLVTLEGPFTTVDSNPDNFLNYPHLRISLQVREGLLPGFFFDVNYDKMLIREAADLISIEAAILKARLNYRTGPALISFFYQIRFEEEEWDDSQTTMGLETTIRIF